MSLKYEPLRRSPPMSPQLIAARVAGGEGVMGAVHEGFLHLLERKKKVPTRGLGFGVWC